MKNSSIISFLLALAFQIFSFAAAGQNLSIQPRLEPASWWIGFENPEVQLLAYGKNIAALKPVIEWPGVSIERYTTLTNPNYLFIDIRIDPSAQPGSFDIQFYDKKKKETTRRFTLLQRQEKSALREGFNSNDAIYLLMPDRFANSDSTNDSMPGMIEKANRKAPYGRHGGDLKGIQEHLDYIASMGFTALWLNPVLENNQPESSYHGYAITDYYNVDPRLGTNEQYQDLVNECGQRDIKVIMDMVFNHCGSNHWWMNDLPSADWINYDHFVRSNYRIATISDPYASNTDKELATRGWFDTSMPDLNLENSFLLNYLIQNSIWWIEYANLRGIRMDTYPYPNQKGMTLWMQRIYREYPNLNIVGEVWVSEPSKLCYWQKNFSNHDGYNSYLPSLMDFPMQVTIKQAFNEQEGWDSGMNRLYEALANDHLYTNPMNLVVFPENHDEGRIFLFLKRDIRKMKMMIAYLATIRGIPQWYSGSEILMDGNGFDGHANIRKDFPGGWTNDSINNFISKGRTAEQNEILDYLTALLNYRKSCEPLQKGRTLHFLPENDLYVYFRYTPDKAVMVILNNAEEENQTVEGVRFNELLKNYSKGREVVTGKTYNNLNRFTINAKSALVIELMK